jgi:hypothetical protein
MLRLIDSVCVQPEIFARTRVLESFFPRGTKCRLSVGICSETRIHYVNPKGDVIHMFFYGIASYQSRWWRICKPEVGHINAFDWSYYVVLHLYLDKDDV